jgi:hypothetical protein
MDIKLSLRKRDDLISEVSGIFYMGKHQKYSYEDILKWISERVYNTDRYKKIPLYRKTYIEGYIRANFHLIQTSEIEQKIYWNNELISTKDNRLTGHWREINELPKENQAHMYWKNTDKVYY